MDYQLLFNIAATLVGALMGWILKSISDRMDHLQAADSALSTKVQEIEVLVAGKYVTWDGLKDVMIPITAQLNRIEAKVDGKADK